MRQPLPSGGHGSELWRGEGGASPGPEEGRWDRGRVAAVPGAPPARPLSPTPRVHAASETKQNKPAEAAAGWRTRSRRVNNNRANPCVHDSEPHKTDMLCPSSADTPKTCSRQAGILVWCRRPGLAGSPHTWQSTPPTARLPLHPVFAVLSLLDSETKTVVAAPGCWPEALRREVQGPRAGGSSRSLPPAMFQDAGYGRGTHGEKPQPQASKSQNAQSEGVQGEESTPRWGWGVCSVHQAPIRARHWAESFGPPVPLSSVRHPLFIDELTGPGVGVGVCTAR